MYRRLTLTILLMVCSSSVYGRGHWTDYVRQGGNTVSTAGFVSTTTVDKSFPSSTVTVYKQGTTTTATIYSDATGTAKANPFTAGTDGSFDFYSDEPTVDIKFSGTGITVAFTWSDVKAPTSAASTVFNVRDYGAKGDGVTNDTTAINAAVTALISAGGGRLYFPSSTNYYKTTTGITISITTRGIGAVISGDGPNSVLFNTGGAGIDCLTLDGSTLINGAHISIENMAFGGGVSSRDVLVIKSLTNVHLSNINASGGSRYTVHMLNATVGAWNGGGASQIWDSPSNVPTYGTPIAALYLEGTSGSNGFSFNGCFFGNTADGSALTITNATNTTPITITSTAHGMVKGQVVIITGVTGNTAANGTFQISNVAANTFDLVDQFGNGISGNGAYVNGGSAVPKGIAILVGAASYANVWNGGGVVSSYIGISSAQTSGIETFNNFDVTGATVGVFDAGTGGGSAHNYYNGAASANGGGKTEIGTEAHLPGGVTIGGTFLTPNAEITNHYSATSSLSFPSTNSGAESDLTITVTGAATGDTVVLGIPSVSIPSPCNTCTFFAWVSAANTVNIRFVNAADGVARQPAQGTFRVDVWHH